MTPTRSSHREETRLRLVGLRKKAGKLTQLEISEITGINLTRYWQIENSYGRPVDEREKTAIAEALGVPIEDAFPVLAEIR